MTINNTSDLNVKDLTFIKDIKSIAIIGTNEKRNFGFLRAHIKHFEGKVYAVNPIYSEIPGLKDIEVYPSLLDIPDNTIDYAYILVPAKIVLSVMDDCVEKGVKLVSIFTSDFSDSGTKEGIEREQELLRRAKNKVRILGPNGMGLFYPKLGISWTTIFPKTHGNISFIGQSGGLCFLTILGAAGLGLKISKAFSYGNGADLDFVDILHFLINDDETDIILGYVEGIKEGRGQDLKKVLDLNVNEKPIIILKGGQTKAGSIATKTHTASISGENQIWKSLFDQYNIIQADSLEQLLSLALLIERYGYFKLDNAAVLSASGGYGVILTDIVEKVGINVPSFSPEIQKKLDSHFYLVGTSSKNPLDLAAIAFNSQNVINIMDVALSDERIDGLILDLPSYYFNADIGFKYDPNMEENLVKTTTLGHMHNKPVIPIVLRLNCPIDKERIFTKILDNNVPVFSDPLEVMPLLPKISKYSKNRKSKN